MFTYAAWNGYPIWKKLFIGTVALFGFVIVLSVLKVLLVSQGVSRVTWPEDFSDDVSVMTEGGAPSGMMAIDVDSRMYKGYNTVPPQIGGQTVGNDGENYESFSYTALFKKRDHVRVCDTIESWKPLQHVVFERAERGDSWCQYDFKVERAQAEGVVESIQNLKPSELTEGVESIQRQVVEYDSQLNILLQKQDMLEKMLADAVGAYDELVVLATSIEDVETLTKIIDSKLRMIENLTQQRIALSQQIDALTRRSAELADQIEYVRFSIHVEQYKILDVTALKDSWVRQMQQFVYNINKTFQELTLGVLGLFVEMVVAIVYISIVGIVLLVCVKYGWKFVRRFWSAGNSQNVGQ